MTSEQKSAALHCSVALGCLDALMRLEKPKSARWNRLNGAMEHVNRCVDMYRMESFSYEDCIKAEKVFDAASDKIKEFYP